MRSNLTTGNAPVDSREFRQWFVGDIEGWVAERSDVVDISRFGLRNSKLVEIKWGIHSPGERRAGGWASRTEKTALSILIDGRFVISVREASDPKTVETVLLKEQGDYVLWKEELEHFWHAEAGSTVLTVRWS